MTPEEQLRLELTKVQYERLTNRYENIYKAVWQNFQYLALISGAILAFGKDFEHLWLIIVLSGLPLLFWLFAQYIPMDRYGHATRCDLAEIERYLEGLAGGKIAGFNHYSDFSKSVTKEAGLWGARWRVRNAVACFAILMIILWAWAINRFYNLDRSERKQNGAKGLAEIVVDVEGIQQTQRFTIRAVPHPPNSVSVVAPTSTTPRPNP